MRPGLRLNPGVINDESYLSIVFIRLESLEGMTSGSQLFLTKTFLQGQTFFLITFTAIKNSLNREDAM